MSTISGILLATLVYLCALFVIIIVVKSFAEPNKPISQTVTDVKTLRYPDGSLDLKFETTFEVFPSEITISMIRSLYNVDTGEIFFLPHQMLHVEKGVHTYKVVNPLPKNLIPGDYYYVRSFNFTPALGMVSKNFKYDPIEFRVCKEKGECLIKK